MDVRRTVKARPDGNIEGLVEDAAHFSRGQRVALEAKRADAPPHVAMAVDVVAPDLVEPPPQTFGQLDFASMNLVDALLLHVLDARGESGYAKDVGGAAFEEVGKLAGLGFAGGIAAGAALAPGADFRPRPDVQGPGSRWPEERLVPGERQQIDAGLLHVNRHGAGRLGRVDQEQQVVLAGDAADLGDWLNCAQNVAGVRQSDQPRAR